jgi:formiminotetrahydrofolate cyclodeaminase
MNDFIRFFFLRLTKLLKQPDKLYFITSRLYTNIYLDVTESEIMLAKLTVKEFFEKTASKDPVPGGGSIAALSAAAASSLVEMVANLTIGKKGYGDVEEEMKAISKQASRYREKLVQDMDNDSNAYEQVMVAFRLPKCTEEEITYRKEAIETGLKNAALVPLGVAKDASNLMDLAGEIITKGYKTAVTDGMVAAVTARSAALSALYNVKINLNSIKDRLFVHEVSQQITHLENEIRRKEKQVLSK